MKLELYVPNSVVVTEGDVPQSLFIVASGTVVRENPVRDDGSSDSTVRNTLTTSDLANLNDLLTALSFWSFYGLTRKPSFNSTTNVLCSDLRNTRHDDHSRVTSAQGIDTALCKYSLPFCFTIFISYGQHNTRCRVAQDPVEMGPGTVFSKVAVLCNVPQLFTVRTRDVCELLKMDKSALARILQAYPKDSRQMLDNLKRVSARPLACGRS